jgi:HlyD family secretion protein
MPSDQPTLKDLRIAEEAREGAGGRVGVWILLALLLIGVAGGGWWWVRGPAPLVVRAYTVVEQDATGGGAAPAVLNASGYVVARRRATVSSKVTGKVVEVLVEEGKAVTRGQVLARLDDGTARRYLDLAQAELSASRRGAAETEVRLKEARQTQVRTRSLVKDGISGQADLDKADAEVGALEARLELTREQVLVAERQVAVRQNDLDDTTVRAPFSGVAISKDAQPGEMVSPMSAGGGFTRTGLCTIVDMTSLEIEVDVNESYINRVVPAQRVEATLDAYPDWKIPAHVITMVPTADRQKATVLVRIGFEKLDARLLPDMGVKVTFLGVAPTTNAQPRPRLVLPSAAVRHENGQAVVFVIKDDVAERRAVRVGTTQGEQVDILSGVSAGERVVVDGPPDLADGRKLTVR